MPIPEPSRFKPSNLTAEQRQRETAAAYGVNMQEFTHEEIERMRKLVQSSDAQRQPMKTFDLNNPPREPYTHQEFPKMVYDHERSIPGNIVCLVVRNADDLSVALDAGYSKEAPAFGDAPEESELKPEYQRQVATIQEQIEQQRTKRPYNRKAA